MAEKKNYGLTITVSWGRATKAAGAGIECSIFLFKTKFWVLLIVGKGRGRQAGSLKYPPRKVSVHGN
jgi:hypothetical protein